MSSNIRVLIADDSAVVRRLLTETIANETEMDVVFQARNGAEAVEAFPGCTPDVVVLDVEMPVMDGVETVSALRKIDPHVPVIMFSSLTTRGGEATLDALSHGASDYVTKPTGTGHVMQAVAHIRRELIPKIVNWGKKHRCCQKAERPPFPAPPVESAGAASRTPTSLSAPPPSAPVEIVAVGASTGGPDALSEFLRQFPSDFASPVVVVQHMPPVFTKLLAERLDNVARLPVREAVEDVTLEKGHVWIAPGDHHLRVQRNGMSLPQLVLDSSPPENSCRPSVDVLFRSVAQLYGPASMAVVLTGMGKDGLDGARAIRRAGGRVLAQDQASSVVWGMPGAVAEAGLTECLMAPKELGSQVVRSHLSSPTVA